jgi:hypothetical protein
VRGRGPFFTPQQSVGWLAARPPPTHAPQVLINMHIWRVVHESNRGAFQSHNNMSGNLRYDPAPYDLFGRTGSFRCVLPGCMKGEQLGSGTA